MTDIKLSELHKWLDKVVLELALCGIDFDDIDISVNRIGNKQLLNVKWDDEIEATKVW